MGTCTCAAATRATETSGALGLNNLPLPNKRLKQTPRVGGIELFISAALLSRAPLDGANELTLMTRYRADPEGLFQLAADLGESDPKVQARAAQALLKEARLRDAVSLVRASLQIADDAILAGRFDGDRARLEALRPIGAVISRLRELAKSPDPGVCRVAAGAIKSFDQKARVDHGAV